MHDKTLLEKRYWDLLTTAKIAYDACMAPKVAAGATAEGADQDNLSKVGQVDVRGITGSVDIYTVT